MRGAPSDVLTQFEPSRGKLEVPPRQPFEAKLRKGIKTRADRTCSQMTQLTELLHVNSAPTRMSARDH